MVFSFPKYRVPLAGFVLTTLLYASHVWAEPPLSQAPNKALGNPQMIMSEMPASFPSASASTTANLQEHLAAAQRYMAQEHWDYASYEYRAVLKEEPKNVVAIVGLTQALLESGFIEDAKKHLEEYEAVVQSPQIDLAFAQVLQSLDEPILAFKRYDKVLQKEPYNQQAFSGVMQLSKKLPVKTRKVYQKRLKDHATKCRKNAALAIEKHRYKQAVQYYGIASAYFKTIRVINDHAVALLLNGQFNEATQQFRKIIDAVESWKIYNNAGVADLSLGKTFTAKVKIEAALSVAKSPAEKSQLYNSLGYVYEQSQKLPLAQFSYEKALELDPDNQKAAQNLAYIYQKDQQYEAAAALYGKLLSQHPGDAELKTKQGFIYELMNEDRKAMTAYKKALQWDPKYRPAYENMAVLYRKMGKEDKASDTYRQLMAIDFNAIESGEKNAMRKKAADSQSANSPMAQLEEYVDLYVFN